VRDVTSNAIDSAISFTPVLRSQQSSPTFTKEQQRPSNTYSQ
jgi:hypothetical protein